MSASRNPRQIDWESQLDKRNSQSPAPLASEWQSMPNMASAVAGIASRRMETPTRPLAHRAERVSYKHLPPEQREEMRRRSNAEAARRSRQKRKNDQRELQRTFRENENRIAHLENMISELSAEVEDTERNQSSRPGHGSTAKSRRSKQ